jgi:hypothetical protein
MSLYTGGKVTVLMAAAGSAKMVAAAMAVWAGATTVD